MFEEILDFLDFKDIKKNKTYFIVRVVLSFLFALSFFLDMLVTQGYKQTDSYKYVYFESANIKHWLFLIICTIVTFLILSFIGAIVQKIQTRLLLKEKKKSKKRVFFIVLFTIVLCWLPYILSYFPGGVFVDTKESYNMALGKAKLTNHHPLLYTGIIKIFTDIGEYFGDAQIGFQIYTVVQFAIFALVVAYFIYWLYKKGISLKIIVILTLFVGLFKWLPLYAITIWKDTPFAIGILFYSFVIAKIVNSNGEELRKPHTIFQYLFIALFISFIRNNGIYVVVPTTFVLMIAYRNIFKRKWSIFYTLITIEIIAIMIVQGPVYKYFDVQGEFRESVGIPLQQICYVIAHEGNVTEEQLEFINNIEKIQNIRDRYAPWDVDMIKYYEFNDKYLEENKIQFFKVWLQIFLQNPADYVKAYVLNTMGFWDVNRTLDTNKKDYVYTDMKKMPGSAYLFIFDQHDFINEKFGVSIKDKLNPENLISAAVFEFIVIFNLIYVFKLKKKKILLIYLPVLFTMGTLFIAVPVAFSLRYASAIIFFMPFSFVVKYLEIEEK